MGDRRHRCDKHPDQLYNWGEGGCPKCQIVRLEEQVEDLESKIYGQLGEPVAVKIGYPADRIFQYVLGAFGYHQSSRYFANADILIECAPHQTGTRFVIPERIAEALVKAWESMEAQMDTLMERTVDSVSSTFAHHIKEQALEVLKIDLGKAEKKVLEKHLSERRKKEKKEKP